MSQLTYEDISKCFHLTIDDAAYTLEVCPTILKIASRRHNIRRWPYRKFNCLNNVLNRLRSTTNLKKDKNRIKFGIRMLYLNPNTALDKVLPRRLKVKYMYYPARKDIV